MLCLREQIPYRIRNTESVPPYGGSFCAFMAADRAKHAISILLFWLPHEATKRTVPSEDKPTALIRWPVPPRPNACILPLSAEGLLVCF